MDWVPAVREQIIESEGSTECSGIGRGWRSRGLVTSTQGPMVEMAECVRLTWATMLKSDGCYVGECSQWLVSE